MTTAPDKSSVELVAGTAFSLGRMSDGRIMSLAAACTPGSADPVDCAVGRALRDSYPHICVPEVDPGDTDPACPSRRYSLTRVRNYQMEDGTTKDLVVMRGDMESMLKKVKVRRESSSVLRRNAAVGIKRGWRPLAVATAPVDADDKVGDFTLQGFVSVGAADTAPQEDLFSGPAIFARINVWSPSLRLQHWLNVFLVFVMSLTGFYIMDPFFGPSSYDGAETGFMMGGIRMLHFTAGFCWLVVGLFRIWSAFTSRDRYLRWSYMWPLKSKEDLRNLGRTVLCYTFIRTEAPMYLGHNPLQQLTYTLVYCLCGLQALTGLALFGMYHQSNWFWALIATPTHWVGVSTLRLVHALIMFLMWGFLVGHIYLVFRADSVERHGGLSAMINGGVWVKRGTKPVDAPVIE